jgi:uncharacterized OB-fold protein
MIFVDETIRPTPIIDNDNRPFWAACLSHQLVLQQCDDCRTVRYYPGAICIHCSSPDFRWVEVSGRGTVYTYSIVYRAPSPAFAADVPYVYAVVELAEVPMMPTNIIDIAPEAVRIGMPVTVAFRDVSPEVTLPVFKPAEDAGQA